MVSRLRTIARIGAVLGLLTVLVVGAAGPATAHVDLAQSDPPDQAQLGESPNVLELEFSASVASAGEGIQLVDSTGVAVDVSVSQASGERFLVNPTDPLGAGTYAVLWTVRAGDAHPRSGSVVFSVMPTATPTADASSEPQLSVAAPDDSSEAAAVAAAVTSATSPTGDWLTRIGRWVATTGALVAIGVFAFAAFALTGTRREIHEAAFWARRAGLAVIAGSILDAIGTSIALHGSLLTGLAPSALSSTLASSFGFALLLRVTGGLAVLFGTQTVATPLTKVEPSIPDPIPTTDAPKGTVAALAPPQTLLVPHRLDIEQSRIALGGIAAVAISYLFDGHTVTATPGWLVRTADLVHVTAAGVWVGGVLMMGWVLSRRWRQGVPIRAAELAVRFSPVAAVALAAVAAAGLALTWMILDTPGELVGTDWGRTLIAKMIVVGVAAAMGGYNHRNVVPRLAVNSDDEHAEHMLRRLVRVEGAVLVSVIGVTALLVGAAS
jgi:copper transport protein